MGSGVHAGVLFGTTGVGTVTSCGAVIGSWLSEVAIRVEGGEEPEHRPKTLVGV